MLVRIYSLFAVSLLASAIHAQTTKTTGTDSITTKDATVSNPIKTEIITLGGGCFWCVEGAIEILDGVTDVVSGYEGDPAHPNPTYETLKDSKHVEVCQVHFDPAKIKLEQILNVFFKMHDPTSRNKQGADEGPQYRSVVFYHNEAQKLAAEKKIAELNDSGKYATKIVTDVEPTQKFWIAEAYHQDYFRKNPGQGYCRAVVSPKVIKIQELFPELLKRQPKIER
jgi:peptide-methionine (S)-S-oxide reductase